MEGLEVGIREGGLVGVKDGDLVGFNGDPVGLLVGINVVGISVGNCDGA